MLSVLPSKFKALMQQIRLLQVASILTTDWITLRGSHATHGYYVICCKTSLPWAGKTCTDFVARNRTTLCFLQQLFATCINLNCWKTGLNVGGKTRFSTSLAAMLQNKLQVFCCPFCFISKNGVCVILPWVPETFLARFPVSGKSL